MYHPNIGGKRFLQFIVERKSVQYLHLRSAHGISTFKISLLYKLDRKPLSPEILVQILCTFNTSVEL